MRQVRLSALNDFDEWRAAARALLLGGVPPDQVVWLDPAAPQDLFAAPDPELPVINRNVGTVPPRFIEWANAAICHSDPARFSLMYRLLWRLQSDRELMNLRSDPDVGQLDRRVSAVRRDSHKFKAFLRFRSVEGQGARETYLGWFEPDHYVLERVAPFFERRFAGMDWGIVTPYRSAYWNGETLRFGRGGSRADVPAEDAMEDSWRTYFASIFNPARLKVAMMQSEMPKKYWRNLPEATLIEPLIRSARQREITMIDSPGTSPPVRHIRQAQRIETPPPPPATDSISSLPEASVAVEHCRRCPLYEHATQPIFGEGPADADVMIVGEQPGDEEDLVGRPFVGPAGKVLNAAMREAGLDRSAVYLTNAVKHFKFVPQGRRRLHQRPDGGEIAACRFWLDLERTLVKPRIILAMGASAARGLLGRAVTVSEMRGEPILLEDGVQLFVTVHPAYLLRMPDRDRAAAERQKFVADLERVRDTAAALGPRKASLIA